MLQSSYTLDTIETITPANAYEFQLASRSANESIFYAPSQAGDLAGRISLRVSHETTKSGVVRSLVQIKIPMQDSVTQEYSAHRQVNLVLTRPEKDTLASSAELLGELAVLLSTGTFALDVASTEL